MYLECVGANRTLLESTGHRHSRGTNKAARSRSHTRRPGTEHETTQTIRFDYDARGRRVGKHDSFGTTAFIWEDMRLIEERQGSAAISYVYEPGSYVPLARLDADGERTEQGGLGTTKDAQHPGGSKPIAASAVQTGSGGQKHQKN